jgi:hypothetical protein
MFNIMMKDALASAVDIAVAPKQSNRNKMEGLFGSSVKTHSRFGGVAFS